jgi:hypothetical protein
MVAQTTQSAEEFFTEMILEKSKRKFIETLFTIEDKSRKRMKFLLNPIQEDASNTETGRDIWVKPAQCGFSSYKLAQRLADTLTNPGTNTVLIAYEDFITERLLSKADFYYNNLVQLNIPGFPKVKHDSAYEKTYEFVDQDSGKVLSKSSIYIASARSATAGRAKTIHHLLCDEFAFWVPGAIEKILLPALDRVPGDGTVDIFSTANGKGNSFYTMYKQAKEGRSTFTSHFYPWWMVNEYRIKVDDPRSIGIIKFWSDINNPIFELTEEEARLMLTNKLTYEQIRWRRWKIKEKESLRIGSSDEKARLLFPQEFPEDDVTCFLSAGNQFFDEKLIADIAKTNREPKAQLGTSKIWYQPTDPEVGGARFELAIDPGQGKNTQSSLVVIGWLGPKPIWCARDSGLYLPELTWKKALALANHYNHCKITWEANSHGLAITALARGYRPIYWRKDIVDGQESMEPGWLTTSKNKEYMLTTVHGVLPDLICHDIEFARQMGDTRYGDNDKIEHLGLSDILMSFAVNVVCHEMKPIKRGLVFSRPRWKRR